MKSRCCVLTSTAIPHGIIASMYNRMIYEYNGTGELTYVFAGKKYVGL